ncbi:Histidinol dehydrogenase [Raoultella ornithinolytica]|nr:Histidinol dehydrogenase [Raoultella ornithinolytica]
MITSKTMATRRCVNTAQSFDKTDVKTLQVSEEEIAAAGARLSDELKQAMGGRGQQYRDLPQRAKTAGCGCGDACRGVRCQQVTRPIASVGLYIPGGSAPLFSTVLMLATPARIAGCQQVVLCSPPPIADEILYAAPALRRAHNLQRRRRSGDCRPRFRHRSRWQKLIRFLARATPSSPKPSARSASDWTARRLICRRTVGSAGDCRRRRDAGLCRL